MDNNMKDYYKQIHEYIDNLSPEEFDRLLDVAGIDKCPIEKSENFSSNLCVSSLGEMLDSSVHTVEEIPIQHINSNYIIAMDIAKPPFDKADFSCISMMCGNCKTVIHSELFKGVQPQIDKPCQCPECGIEFKCGIVMK